MANKQEKQNQLDSLKLNELKELCKERGYKGFSSLSKADIINFIIEKEDEAPVMVVKPQKRALRKPSRALRGF